jgi:two-component system repressor protein LuxO
VTKPLALIIEDDEDLSTIFTEATMAAGYEVRAFTEGNSAIKHLDDSTPHLVVLDLHLPGVAGPTIFRHIRADARLRDAHVIIASADDRLAEYTRDRTTIVLLKPISFVQLRDLAERLRPSDS